MDTSPALWRRSEHMEMTTIAGDRFAVILEDKLHKLAVGEVWRCLSPRPKNMEVPNEPSSDGGWNMVRESDGRLDWFYPDAGYWWGPRIPRAASTLEVGTVIKDPGLLKAGMRVKPGWSSHSPPWVTLQTRQDDGWRCVGPAGGYFIYDDQVTNPALTVTFLGWATDSQPAPVQRDVKPEKAAPLPFKRHKNCGADHSQPVLCLRCEELITAKQLVRDIDDAHERALAEKQRPPTPARHPGEKSTYRHLLPYAANRVRRG